MNKSLVDTGGQALCVSQFTLYGDCRKGRRPSYDQAAAPDQAIVLYESFVGSLRKRGIPTETGRFRAMMEIELINDGPVTLLLDSDRLF
jgi:D-tyrosyl-tRNA(Tyr) deacylase